MCYRYIESLGGSSSSAHRLEGGAPGLGGFSTEFLNSDHHLGRLVVGGVPSDGRGGGSYETYLLMMNDQDWGISGTDGDPARLSAKYFDLGSLPTFTVGGRAIRRETALAPIPHLAADELLVLRGFEIGAPRDTNHHIRAIGVRHLRERNALAVTFADDSPGDDSFTFAIHYFVILHSSRTGRRQNPHFEGPFQQQFRFTESVTIRKTNPGIAMLSGFSFRFEDGDHHLRKIAVDLETMDSLAVTFTDDERNHPVEAFVEYVLAVPYIV